MTATGHALIGTIIAAKIGNPALAIPIAFASHYLADTVPHWDTATNRDRKSKTRFTIESVVDLLLGFVLSGALIALFFPSTNPLYAILIIIVAQLPDWITAPYLFLGWNIPPFKWSYDLGKKFDTEKGLPWGFVNQAVVIVALIFLVRIF
ncbi:MAG TPA: hypothetical protein VMR59_00375 [Patescibacteria group bacterium]|jgi:hypothetical protein|nr:hypothetical protein [Patescibacteria group bacterium]